MGNDLVSICIPAYNAEKTIENTLQSILSQSYRDLEVIIIDNASTDNTLSIAQRFKDSRVRIYRNDRNIDGEKNWSRCLELASGDYIAIFHADDIYLPHMVEKQVRAFLDNPSLVAVFTGASHINEHGEVIGGNKLPAKLSGKKIYRFPEIFIHILENGNFLYCPSCMVRGKLYKELMPFDYDRFGTSADLDMWLRILEKYPIAILEEELMCYRISSSQGSYQFSRSRTEQADFFKVMDYYLSLEPSVLNIPHRSLDKYEFQRSLDRITRAVNHLVKGQPEEAKMLLKQSFSITTFRLALGSVGKPKLLGFWIFGIILLGLVYLGLERYLRKRLHAFCSTAARIVNMMEKSVRLPS